jgi:glycosyltransferase involved in cell wall biosynthesis
VLMLTDLYPPFIGGIEEHVRNLSHALVGRGHDVSVATMRGADLQAESTDGQVRVHRLRSTSQRAAGRTAPSGRPFASPFPDPEVVAGLRRLVDTEQPDVVHAHNWLGRSFLPLKARSGAAMVVTLHDYGVVCAKRSMWYRDAPCSGPGFEKCLRCASRNYGTGRGLVVTLGNWATSPAEQAIVDIYLPVSSAVAQGNELAQRNLPYEVVPNFVPDDITGRADPDHPSLAALPEVPFWLFVGALTPHKGVNVLLDAYAGLNPRPPLVLIGARWPDSPTEFPAGTIVLHDLPHAAVMAAWSRASLAIVPSVFPDPCPTVAIEALAAGLPVVASSVGGLPDIVADGETGRLVPVGDAAALRTAISELHGDPETRQSMSIAARDRARRFMASSVVDRIERIYSRLAA